MWLFYILLTLILAIAYFFLDALKPYNYPPGPRWLPIVGCFLELKKMLKIYKYQYLVWEAMSKIYGPVVGLRFGRDRIILISGYYWIKQILIKDEFDARPDGFFFRMRSQGKRLGVVFVEGSHFQEQKKFCLTALKKLGYGKKVMEEIITREAHELIVALKEKSKEEIEVEVTTLFDIPVLNSLWALMAGKRFNLTNEKLSELTSLVHEAFGLLDMSGGILNQMPYLRFVAPNATGYNRIQFVLEKFFCFLKDVVDEHKAGVGPNRENLIYFFLTEMKNRQNEVDSSFTDLQLITLLLDLFMAGSETTSNSLSTLMLYMILYPEVQEQVHFWVDKVPKERLPTLQDKHTLVYVEAVILEVLRHAAVVPMSVAHKAAYDTFFNGFKIPKGSTVLLDLRSIYMDTTYWKNPKVFSPQRFIDSKNQIAQFEWFIPFGYGKRRCLGENLARNSLFLIFSAIMQHFTVTIAKGQKITELGFREGVTLSPHPFRAVLKHRL